MEVVGDLLARDRRSRNVALVTAEGSERTYHDLITNGYKAANVLRHLGAREGSTVAVHPEPAFHTVLAFLGAARLGAAVRFDPVAGVDAGDRVVLAPVNVESEVKPEPGTNLVVFGGPPERPETTHWEAELWSENPGTPPSEVGPDDRLVRGLAGDDATHREILAAAASVVDEHGVDGGTRVVLRSDFSDARALAAGVVAPLSVGGTVVLAAKDGAGDAGGPQGDIAVAAPDATPPEPRAVSLAALLA